jgi:hypothetical protein
MMQLVCILVTSLNGIQRVRADFNKIRNDRLNETAAIA